MPADNLAATAAVACGRMMQRGDKWDRAGQCPCAARHAVGHRAQSRAAADAKGEQMAARSRRALPGMGGYSFHAGGRASAEARRT